jgi:hypothetical protein
MASEKQAFGWRRAASGACAWGFLGLAGRSGRRAARRQRSILQIRGARRRTNQLLRVRSNTIQVPLSGINKKKSHGQGWRRAKPDAGPVIKSGFYGVDKATESHKVYRYDTEWAEVLAI